MRNTAKGIVAALLTSSLGVAGAPVEAGVSLVADLAPGKPPSLQYPVPAPSGFAVLGTKVFFVGWDSSNGSGLWVSDGTAAGTRPLLRNALGPIVAGSERVFVGAVGEQHGLWATDGTTAGTWQVVRSEEYDPPVQMLAPRPGSGDTFLLRCRSSTLGCSVLATRGTPATTRTVVELPAAYGDERNSFLRSGSRLYVAERNALWSFGEDGTALHSVSGDDRDGPRPVGVGDKRVVFGAQGQLWGTDGTAAGTAELIAIAGDDVSHFNSVLVSAGKFACTQAYGTLIGHEMVCTDGTRAGTRKVTDFGYAYPFIYDSPMGAAGGRFYFSASSGTASTLWFTTGSTAKELTGCSDACPRNPREMRAAGSRLLFVGDDPTGAARIYITDGTGAGTRALTTPCAGCAPPGILEVQGTLAFLSVSELGAGSVARRVTKRSDGTTAGTWTLPLGPAVPNSGGPTFGALPVGGWMVGVPARSGQALWRYDGSRTAPKKILEFERLRRTCYPDLVAALGGGVVAACGDRGLLRLSPESGAVSLISGITLSQPKAVSTAGRALVAWGYFHEFAVTDGTPAGTQSLSLRPSWGRSGIGVFGDSFLVTSWGHVGNDMMMAISAVAPGSTELVERLTLPFWFPGDIAAAGSDVLFEAGGVVYGTDLTVPGTHAIAENLGYPRGIHQLQRRGNLLLWSSDQGGPYVRRDGDPAGVRLLAAGLPAPYWTVSGRYAFLRTFDSLFRVDLDEVSASGSSSPLLLKKWGGFPSAPLSEIGFDLTKLPDGRVLFGAYDPVAGFEPHVSDGTPAGTKLLFDVEPGPGSGYRSAAVVLGDIAYFKGRDNDHGDELWRTAGSAGSTARVVDLWPGAQSSSPEDLVVAEGRLYFVADDGRRGREIWLLE